MPTRPNQGGSKDTWGDELEANLAVSIDRVTGRLIPASVKTALGGSQSLSHYDPRLQYHGNSLSRLFASADQSFGVLFKTDSTGNDKPASSLTGDYPYEWAVLVAAAQPAYTVRWRVWDDTSQDYLAPVVIQTGTADTRSIRFPGTGFTYSLPSTVVATPPTDFDVSVLLSLDDWTPAAIQAFAAHSNGAGVRGWWMNVETNGKISLTWSNDGTALNTVTSSVAPTVTDGSFLWVRATMVASTGVIKFYTSAPTDGATWTQLGTTTTFGATTLFNPTSPYYIGSRDGGNTALMVGNVAEIRVRASVNGGYILPAYADQWEPVSSASPSGATGAPIFDVIAGAMPGQGLAYLSNATRIPLLTPNYALKTVFFATSHNESSNNINSVWLASWDTWVTAVKARAYEAVPVIMTQNPEFLGGSITALLLRAHTMRRSKLLAWAQQKSYASYDGWQAFLDTGQAQHYINATDFLHPRLDIQAGDTYSGAQIEARDLYTAMFSGI